VTNEMKLAAWIGGAVAALCVALLLVDCGIARYREPRDDKLVESFAKAGEDRGRARAEAGGRAEADHLARKARKLRTRLRDMC
jgi:hypothetical protein